MMNFFSRGFQERVEQFNQEMYSYFDVALTYLVKSRTGAVIVVDADTEAYEMLSFLAGQCAIDMQIIHVPTENTARNLIEDMGTAQVKAVIVSSASMTKKDVHAMTHWLSKFHPEIPVWIYNCTPKEVPMIRKVSARLGILMASSAEMVKAFTEIVGLPSEYKDAEARRC